ncbi:MAG: DUF3352 domain-containing protein [bacterium]|nr:DUF3352 domain-containing protein [bacterium]
MRKLITTVLTLIVAFVSCGIHAAELPRFASRIPAESLAAVFIPDFPELAKGKAWLAPLSEVLVGEVAIALLDVPEKGETPKFILMGQINADKFESLAETRLLPILRRNLGKVELETSDGITDIVVNDSPTAFCAVKDNVFYFSLDRDLLTETLSKPLAAEKALQGNLSFAKLLEKVPSPSRCIFVVNAPAVLEALGDKIPEEVRGVLKGAGLLDISVMGGGTGLRDGAPVASFSLISSEKLRGLLPLYAQPPMPTTSAGFIPQDYSAYVRLGFTSFAEGWQTLKRAVRGMAGEEGAEGIADFLEQFRQNTGLDFEKDFLASLGGEVAVAAAVPEKLRIPDAVALLEVKDREKFEKMLLKLFPLPPMGSETYKDVPIRSVQLGPLPAAYALVENYFVFGTDVSAVRSVVDARRSGVSLAGNPAFRSAMGGVGEGAHVVYLDIGSAMPLLLSAISRFATEWSDEAPDIESPTWVVMGKLLMSPLATNAVLAFSAIGDEGSVTFRGYSTITGPHRMFATSGILAGMLLPALMRARESAHRAACMNNLKQLAMAEKMYAADHDEKFSEKLSDLYPEYVNNFAVFLCPSHREQSVPSKEDIDEQTSYILRKGLTDASPADEVMIHEESWNHRGDGGNAAFVDGHVRWLGASELERLIEKDQGSAEQ